MRLNGKRSLFINLYYYFNESYNVRPSVCFIIKQITFKKIEISIFFKKVNKIGKWILKTILA